MTYLQHFIILIIITSIVSEQRTALNMKVSSRSSTPPILVTPRNYLELISKSKLFIDKSLLMKQLLEDERKTVLISRPKHWGKSINLDMIKTFFEMPVDDKANPLPNVTSTSNYRLFVNGEITNSEGEVLEKLKNPFLISKHQSFIDDYLGKYPVIYISFTDIKGRGMSSVISAMMDRIGDAFIQHKHLLDLLDQKRRRGNNMLKKAMAEKNYTLFKNFVRKESDLQARDVKDSINFLVEIIYIYYNKSAIVLIDDYDGPLIGVLSSHGKANEEEENFIHFYTSFLNSTFSSNLKKAILTGTFRLWKEAHVTMLNTITEDHLYSTELHEFFGFNENEISSILQHLELDCFQAEVTSYYGGYRCHGVPQQFYNPVCVANFLKDVDLQKCLLKGIDSKRVSNLIQNFQYFAEFKERMQCAITSENQEVKLKVQAEHFTWKEFRVLEKATLVVYDLKSFKNLIKSFNKAEISDKAILFLSVQGYFSFDLNVTTHNYLVGHVRLPNTDVAEFIKACHAKAD